MTRLKQCMFLVAAFAGILSLASRAPAQPFGYAPQGGYPAMNAGYAPGAGGPPPGMMMPPPGEQSGLPPSMRGTGMPPGMMGPGGPGGMPPGMMGPGGMPPGMMGPGGPGGMPPGGGLPPDYGQAYGGEGGGGDCYGGGCEPGCNCLGCLLGFTDGYKLRPRWYDIQVDYLQLTREHVSRPVDFTSLGIAGPTVLSTDDLNFGAKPGMKLTGALLIAPATNLEATYIGNFFWRSTAQVSGNANLYSALSQFGTVPAGGFTDTDAASLATIEYTSVLDSWELSVRHRFAEPEGRYHGSWLAGFRYVRLDEKFRHFTVTDTGSMDYTVRTFNDLIGFQTGGDFCLRPTPRLLIGAEGKAGIYGNPGEQQTTINATTIAGTFVEREINTEIAFVGEADFFAVYNINQRCSIRGGYQLFYLAGVALATENFNAGPPFVAGARTPFVNVDGDVFYHGFHIGLEYVW